MSPLVSVMIPTRSRIESLTKTIASFLEMAAAPDRVEILVRVHEDDPATRTWAEGRDKRIRVVMGDTEQGYGSIHKFINCLAAVSNGDWLTSMSDEFTMLTQGWDELVRQQPLNPRKECRLLTAKIRHWPESRIGIMSRGLYRAVGHFGMTEFCDSYIDSLTHFAGIQVPVPIELQEGAQGPVLPRDRQRTWSQDYRSQETADCFAMDKIKLGAVLGKPITVKWTPLDAPDSP